MFNYSAESASCIACLRGRARPQALKPILSLSGSTTTNHLGRSTVELDRRPDCIGSLRACVMADSDSTIADLVSRMLLKLGMIFHLCVRGCDPFAIVVGREFARQTDRCAFLYLMRVSDA